MSGLFDAIKFSGYKSFPSDNMNTISRIAHVNLFIGKNNCGKSSILDIIGSVCQPAYYRSLSVKPTEMITGHRIKRELIEEVEEHSYLQWSTKQAMLKHLDETIWTNLIVHNGYSAEAIRYEQQYSRNINTGLQEKSTEWRLYADKIHKADYCFVKIAAERNIVPERAIDSIRMLADGQGATNVIRNVINNRKYDETWVEIDLLDALNRIMEQDAQFESIRVQEVKTGKDANETLWEVYLQENGSTRFPLSQSGSGLKTIILVLLNLIVIPKIEPQNQYVFAFEELENNLHPALQRRLYEYIYDYAIKNNTYIFLTTHSHVAINMFFGKEEAALYHVVKKEKVSTVKQIENYLDKADILDDLDVKASDLLQANGVVWVEGPSDRVYIKQWLKVFGGEDVQEGRDFQFAYYGGRLLSHYTVEEDAKELINILLINRNSAIIIDSDKRTRATPINDTKKRIVREFEEKKLFSWVTKGKEIENYVSFTAINSALMQNLQQQCGKYELFPDYIKSIYPNFTSKKVEFAIKVKDFIDDIAVLDLETQIKSLYRIIKSWNK